MQHRLGRWLMTASCLLAACAETTATSQQEGLAPEPSPEASASAAAASAEPLSATSRPTARPLTPVRHDPAALLLEAPVVLGAQFVSGRTIPLREQVPYPLARLDRTWRADDPLTSVLMSVAVVGDLETAQEYARAQPAALLSRYQIERLEPVPPSVSASNVPTPTPAPAASPAATVLQTYTVRLRSGAQGYLALWQREVTVSTVMVIGARSAESALEQTRRLAQAQDERLVRKLPKTAAQAPGLDKPAADTTTAPASTAPNGIPGGE